MYNRRKKKEWSVIGRQKKLDELNAAILAVEARTATEEQATLVAKHQQHQAELAEKNKRTWGGAVFGKSGAKEPAVGASLGAAVEETGRGVVNAVGEKAVELKQAATATHAATSDATRVVGGPLDQMAQNVVQAASSETKDWISWIRGR